MVDFIHASESQGFTREDLNKANKAGATPVYLAAELNLCQAIQAFAEKGEDLDLCDCNGVTPLLAAARLGNTQAAAALLKAGARAELKDKKNNLPLRICIKQGLFDTALGMLETGRMNVDILADDVGGTLAALSHSFGLFV